jgi:hypothetical protein
VKLADLAAKWKSKGLLFAVPPSLQQQQCQHKTSRAQRVVFICTRGKVKIIKFYFLVLSAHDNPTKLLNASPQVIFSPSAGFTRFNLFKYAPLSLSLSIRGRECG